MIVVTPVGDYVDQGLSNRQTLNWLYGRDIETCLYPSAVHDEAAYYICMWLYPGRKHPQPWLQGVFKDMNH